MAASPQEITVGPLQTVSDPDTVWTTTNFGEAIPGLQTPLSASIWMPLSERVLRNTSRTIGAMTKQQATVPARREDWIVGMFFGKAAFRPDHFVGLGDRMPGTSGKAVAETILGYVPRGLEGKAERRYYPLVALKLPAVWMRWPRKLRNARVATERWARNELAAIQTANVDQAHQHYLGGTAMWERNLLLQGVNALTMVSPVLDLLTRLCQKTGTDTSLMAGYGGHDETQMVSDLWACSRGRLDFDVLVERHGFHGPREGELSSMVWREDQTPLREILDGYRSRGDELDPANAEQARAVQRAQMEDALMRSLPRRQRISARLIMAAGRKVVPLRGVAKAAFVQSIDVTRAAARRLGTCLANDGILDDPSDIFFLTDEEVRARRWAGQRDVIASRRAQYESFRNLGIPTVWRGYPEPVDLGTLDRGEETVLEGVAASAGVVEGPVKVMANPGDTNIEPGDILVASITDPGWASVMFLAAGLVTDVGGLLSHTAVVARELGVPCVVGTKTASQTLRTGDICRVDGTTGHVHILKRVKDARA